MKNLNKILLIGLPRCGSQYITKYIWSNFYYLDLLEPFTNSHPWIIQHADNKIGIGICESPQFSNYRSRVDYIYSVFDKMKPNDKGTVIKYFPDTENLEMNYEIVDKLLGYGFNPIIINRNNIENHIMSWLVAKETNIWDSETPITHNEGRKIKITLDGREYFDSLEWLRDCFKIYHKIIKNYGTNAPVINYETAVDDIESMFKQKIKTSGLPGRAYYKLLPENPYECIVNVNQVKQEVHRYIKLIQNDKLNVK